MSADEAPAASPLGTPAERPGAAAPPPPPAAEAARHRRGPLAWVVHDGSLKVLALVLAVMMWTLVRGKIETHDNEDVDVEVVDLPRDVRLEGGNVRRVALALFGAAADVERAKSDLVRTGRRITLRLAAFQGERGTTLPLSDPRKFGYPFEGGAEVVQTVNPPLQFTWHRVREVAVDVAFQPEDLITGRPDIQLLPGSMTFEPTKVRVVAPLPVAADLARPGATLRLDPIDVTRWVADDPELSVPVQYESGFAEWRGNEPLKDSALLTIDPPTVRGRLRLRQIRSEAVENALQVLFPAGADRTTYDEWEWEIAGSGGEYDRTRRTIRLPLRGDTQAIQDLKEKPDHWCFVIPLPRPPGDAEPPPENVKTPVAFQWLSQEAAPPVRIEGGPTVFVSLRRRR